MKDQKMMMKLVLILISLVMAVILVGCSGSGGGGGADADDNPVDVVSVTPHSDYVEAIIGSWEAMEAFMKASGAEGLTLSTSLGGYGTVADGEDSTQSIWDYFKLIVNALWNIGIRPIHPAISSSKVVYKWKDGGNPESGLLVQPLGLGPLEGFPMIVFLHPTQTERSQSPSNNIFDNEITAPYAKFLSMLGYIVLAPDYPGLGVNEDVHPYCLTTLAKSAVGMVYAAKKLDLQWDGRIFLMGYSEGGYATLVTAKEIQLNHKELNLVAAAALSGPHSLSDAMHKVMLTADAEYQTPYFLPYVVAGYGEQYPEVIHFNTAVIDEPQGFNWDLYKMLFGDYAGGDISKKMREVDPYEGPRSILTAATLSSLNDPDSKLNQVFKENDSFNDWSPSNKVRILLCHNPYDETVPVQNTKLAKEAWKHLANVEELFFNDYLTGEGTVHAGALPYAYIQGTAWINKMAGK